VASADDIRAFMRTRYPKTGTFISTITRDGRPLIRQLTTLVGDDFTVEAPSARTGLKAGHIRRNPNATFLWVELQEAVPARTVALTGLAEIIEDEPSVRDFLDRYNAHYGTNMAFGPQRSVVRMKPGLLRAEKFRGDDRSRPVIIRDFTTLEVLEINTPT
jgi:pyridoxine/pyridoxamine 5'-phosphate oxidase